MSSGNLTGKAAIVTGGAQGIGGATARALAAAGAEVLIVDVDEPAAAANAQTIIRAGGQAAHLIGDVSQEEIAKAMVESALGAYGRLDVLVQNAYGGGWDRMGSAVEVAPQAWRAGLDLLWQRFAVLDDRLRSDQPQLLAGTQAQQTAYRVFEQPAGFEVEDFIASWGA